MTRSYLLRSVALASAALLVSAATAQAQMATMFDRDDSRPEAELRVDMRGAVDRDTDVADTALVLSNTTNQDTHVLCVSYDANGNAVGRKFARLPARGVRYLRASDFSNGADFIGSASCTSRGRVAASAVFLAPGAITNLDVIQGQRWDDTNRVRFPLIATY